MPSAIRVPTKRGCDIHTWYKFHTSRTILLRPRDVSSASRHCPMHSSACSSREHCVRRRNERLQASAGLIAT
eukprot:360019-Chlamydomonas_euryale.AAC.17